MKIKFCIYEIDDDDNLSEVGNDTLVNYIIGMAQEQEYAGLTIEQDNLYDKIYDEVIKRMECYNRKLDK